MDHGRTCTATLVSPRIALTAAHCLYSQKLKQFVPARTVRLLFEYEAGNYNILSRVANYEIGRGYDPENELKTLGFDWAILNLTENVSVSSTLSVSSETIPPGAEITLAGFHKGQAHVLSADQHCKVVAISGNVLLSTCMATHGDSGGPVLIKGPNQNYRIIGIEVGTVHTKAGLDYSASAATSNSTFQNAMKSALSK